LQVHARKGLSLAGIGLSNSLQYDSGDDVALMINGLGGTPPESRPIVMDITQRENVASRNAGRGGPLA
jgi:dihydroxyacetone kinase